jgi:Mg-chelatase subunit ChlD
MRRRGRARLVLISAAAQGNVASERRFNAQLALVACGAALAFVAAAQPRWGERDEVVLSKGRNVVIAVDVSRSMLAEDVRPNRLERARVDLRDLLADLRGDRAGLMAFRGGAALMCPLTTDTAFLRQALEGLGVDSAPRGETDIGGAIAKALETLEAFPGDHNAVVLISDGEDLGGKAVEVAKKAGERGIPIFTVGLGDARGAAIPTAGGARLQYKGEEVVTKLDNQTLLDVATASGGRYIAIQTAAMGRETLGTLYQRHLRNVAAQDLQERSERRKVERYQWFLIPGLLCFAAAAFLSQGRPVRRRLQVAASAAALFVALGGTGDVRADGVATNAPAAVGRDLAREAQAAFRSGRYDEAAETYLAAARHPSLDARTASAFRFNAALAQLRGGATTNAADTFRDVIRQAPEMASAHEGLGAALFDAASQAGEGGTNAVPATERVRFLDEAAAAFQQALRELPPDDARRGNLAAAAARIPGLRDEAHLAEVMEKHGKTPPEQLLAELLKGQRKAYATAAAAMTNDSPSQIEQLEAAAKAQQDTSDLWFPLAPQLMQAFAAQVTNQQQLAQIQQQLFGARDRMRAASATLRDLDPAGLDAITRTEQDALQFFAMVAPPPPILDEAILAQTNALRSATTSESPRTPVVDQAAAQAFTQLFQERFPAWADQMAAAAQQQSASPEGASPEGAAQPPPPPTLTTEQREEIERLAKETLQLQAEVLATAPTPDGRLAEVNKPQRCRALEKLLRIRELLPKPPSQDQKQDQQQQDQQPQQQQQQDQQPKPGEDPQEKPDQPPEENPKPDEPQEQPKEEPVGEAKDDKEPMPDELQAMMDRVLRQEKERDEEQRKRDRSLPPLLGERDW